MSDLKIFNSPEFGQVRTVTIDNEVYFVGVDVAKALEYIKPSQAVIDHCKGIRKLGIPSQGGIQDTNVISEGDIYRLIIKAADQSKSMRVKEKAEHFEKWIFDEVLPSIRKTGSYQKPLSAIEQLQLTQKALLEVDEKITSLDEDLQSFKQDMPILGIEESKITAAVRKTGVHCLGGKDSEAYQDKSLRGKVYSDIYGQLKRQFGVATYKAIKRSQCDNAVDVIENYELPLVLAEQVVDCNAQTTM